jgi:hypothetical protein
VRHQTYNFVACGQHIIALNNLLQYMKTIPLIFGCILKQLRICYIIWYDWFSYFYIFGYAALQAYYSFYSFMLHHSLTFLITLLNKIPAFPWPVCEHSFHYFLIACLHLFLTLPQYSPSVIYQSKYYVSYVLIFFDEAQIECFQELAL